jgi:hypothetical protein
MAGSGFGGVGLVPVDLAAGSSRDRAGTFAVNIEPEAVVAGSDRDDLPGVDHADLDLLPGDHDGAALRHTPLHRYRTE